MTKNFERLLKEKFGFPDQVFKEFEPIPTFKPPEFGSEACARVIITWRDSPKDKMQPDGSFNIEDTNIGFMAEFDLRTGETKAFGIHEQKLIDLFAKGQAQLK